METVSGVASWIGDSDCHCDNVDSVTLQLYYSVAGVSETVTSHLNSSTARLSPYHLIAGHN